jgi:hypothetical protein
MAGDERHSTGRKELTAAELPEAVCAGLEELRAAFASSGVRCLAWNDNYAAVAMEVSVDLPSRGPINDLDIRSTEPILLLLHRRHFPQKAPLVYSDRADFPVARLPHLIPTGSSKLARLCLHRGSLDDWFAEHNLADLVRRVPSWLRDAASNRLIRMEDRFEGTRLEDVSGIVVYPPEELIATVEAAWKSSGGKPGGSYLMATLLKNELAKEYLPSLISYRIDFAFPDRPSGKLVDLFTKYNRVLGEQPQEDKLLFGLLVWSLRAPVSEYYGWLPSSYAELKVFCERLGIELAPAVDDYCSIGAQLLGGVPIIVAILRPQLLIGTNSPVELVHFTVLGSEEHCEADGRWKDETPVLVLSHRTPLTVSFAREMSREPSNKAPSSIAIVGCGAVGSKLSLHLARAGHVNLTLIDGADLAPHHLVRHGLPPGDVGKNKAEALLVHINSMYRLDTEHLDVRAHPAPLATLLDRAETFANTSLILDATASSAVLNTLVTNSLLPVGTQYSRCEITDEGRMGLLFWEGPARNPRVDDLQAFLFNLGQRDPLISRWLCAHRKAQEGERSAVLEEIGIGLSCSSTTLRLADDTVSFHSSLFAAAYKLRDRWATEAIGRVQMSVLDVENGVSAGAQTLAVEPVTILMAQNSTFWQARVQTAARAKVAEWMKTAGRKETGGLLLGFVHKKRKIIYVTDVLPPSRDSKGTPYAFKRGVKDYPKVLDEVTASTGGLIGYVGEWHTHPDGKAALSVIDEKAVEEIRKHLGAAGIPTHIMVFGKDGLASFVFDPD